MANGSAAKQFLSNVEASAPSQGYAGGFDDAALSDISVENVESKTPKWWWIAFACAFLMLLCGAVCVNYLIKKGVGLWGLNYPVAWAWDITNFVFWIGIGHAGTLISAILYLLRQRWRTSINRVAEAMTLFAVICAFIYPLIHTGRPWYAWWLLPVSNASATNPQFRSPLTWDVFAILTYFTVSFLFFYTGLLPDFALLRDRAKTRLRKTIYHILSLGWNGSTTQWRHYQTAYLLLAALLTPLVVSVHSIVSYDFSISILPLWHTTLLPPYFVAGAIFSGTAMVLTLLIPLRKLYGLENLITSKHIESLCKIALATSLFISYCYFVEFFGAYFSENRWEINELKKRVFGNYSAFFWIMLLFNALAPQLFWSKKIRQSAGTVFAIAILINVGMWCERFLLIVSTLSNGFLPSTSGHFTPTYVDVLTFVGSIGLFLTLFLLFLRFIPAIAAAEVKGAVSKAIKKTVNEDKTIIKPTAFNPQSPHIVIGEYKSIEDLTEALKRLKKAGLKLYEAHIPYPIRSVENAVEFKQSFSGVFAFFGGAFGLILGLFIVWYMNSYDYPIIVSARPMFNIFLAAPVGFEISILFAGIGVFAGMFYPKALPSFSTIIFKCKRFSSFGTRDRFYLSIDSADEKYSADMTQSLLTSTDAVHIEFIQK